LPTSSSAGLRAPRRGLRAPSGLSARAICEREG
jgi:hypothetical protein